MAHDFFGPFFEMSNASCTIHLTDERGYIDHAQLRVAYYSSPIKKSFEIKVQIISTAKNIPPGAKLHFRMSKQNVSRIKLRN